MRFLRYIPNTISLLNLVMGCMAIICFLENGYTMLGYDTRIGDYTIRFFSANVIQGTLYIWIASLLDFVDGWIAKKLNAQSSLGRQLDSLCDIVSFGLAPSILLYQLLKYSWSAYNSSLDIPTYYLLPAFFITCAAAYRLARFNVRGNKGEHFQGVPVPLVAIGLSALPWAHITHLTIKSIIFNPLFLYGMIFFWSYMMLTKRTMYKLSLSMNRSVNLLILPILAIATIGGFWVVGYLVLLPVTLLYIVLSLFFIKASK